MKIKVRYSVQFETEIDVEDTGFPLSEAYDADIKVPENENNKYLPDTFEIICVTNLETGERHT